jgi:hypothetical protein
VGDVLMRLLSGGNSEAMRLESPQTRTRILLPSWVWSEDVEVDAVGGQNVAITGRERARAVIVNVADGSAREFEMPGEAFAAARQRNAEKVSIATKQGIPLRPVAVVAAGRGADGGLLFMAAPYRVENAIVLRVDAQGRATEPLSLRLPDRMTPGFGIPGRLGLLDSDLCVAFLQGGVACYSLQSASTR